MLVMVPPNLVPCYGQAEWRVLGSTALQAMDFDVSRKAYVRLKDVEFLHVVAEFQMRALQEPGWSKDPQVRCRALVSRVALECRS